MTAGTEGWRRNLLGGPGIVERIQRKEEERSVNFLTDGRRAIIGEEGRTGKRERTRRNKIKQERKIQECEPWRSKNCLHCCFHYLASVIS